MFSLASDMTGSRALRACKTRVVCRAFDWTHLFEWHCVSFSALAVFSRNALYKSTFYLLTYLLTYLLVYGRHQSDFSRWLLSLIVQFPLVSFQNINRLLGNRQKKLRHKKHRSNIYYNHRTRSVVCLATAAVTVQWLSTMSPRTQLWPPTTTTVLQLSARAYKLWLFAANKVVYI